MGLFNDALPEGLEEVDVIIAGGKLPPVKNRACTHPFP